MDAELHLVETLEDANAFARWLGQPRRVLAVDTETTGFNWWGEDRIRLAQVGDEHAGWSIPWERWGGLFVDLVCRRYDGDLVMHNKKFDLQFLTAAGARLDLGRVHDTQAQVHLYEPLELKALKAAASRHLGWEATVGQDALRTAMRKQKWTWASVPEEFEAYWAYAALDCVLTARLDALLRPRLAPLGMQAAYETELASTDVLAAMERRGIAIDRAYVLLAQQAMEARAAQLRDTVRAEFGVENPNSVQQLARVLDRNGVAYPMTDKGNPNLDKHAIAVLVREPGAAVLRHVEELRHCEKMASTYLANIYERSGDGTLHASINPLGAKTGRMSVSGPSLQNLPRTREIRDAFVAREGHSLVLCDFDQIEMRLMASYSGDPAMIEAFAQGGDFFTTLARQIYGDPGVDKKDPRRQLTKSAAYSKAYGAGVKKFAETARVTVSEGKQFLGAFDRTFPGVRGFQRQVEKIGRQRLYEEGEAYVRTHGGRLVRCEGDLVYKLVNFLLQGSAADVLKQKLVEMDRLGLGDYLVLPVHDEVIADVPREDVEEVSHLVEETMGDRDTFAVELTAGVDVVNRWGDKYDG